MLLLIFLKDLSKICSTHIAYCLGIDEYVPGHEGADPVEHQGQVEQVPPVHGRLHGHQGLAWPGLSTVIRSLVRMTLSLLPVSGALSHLTRDAALPILKIWRFSP